MGHGWAMDMGHRPGKYVFGINLTKRPYGPKNGPALFLPATSRANEASVIELKAGDRKEIGVLRLLRR